MMFGDVDESSVLLIASSIGCSFVVVLLRTIIIISLLLLLNLLLLLRVVRWHDHVIRLDRYFRVSRLLLMILVGAGQAQVLLNARLLLLGCLEEKHGNLLSGLRRRYLRPTILCLSPSNSNLLLPTVLLLSCLCQ